MHTLAERQVSEPTLRDLIARSFSQVRSENEEGPPKRALSLDALDLSGWAHPLNFIEEQVEPLDQFDSLVEVENHPSPPVARLMRPQLDQWTRPHSGGSDAVPVVLQDDRALVRGRLAHQTNTSSMATICDT